MSNSVIKIPTPHLISMTLSGIAFRCSQEVNFSLPVLKKFVTINCILYKCIYDSKKNIMTTTIKFPKVEQWQFMEKETTYYGDA